MSHPETIDRYQVRQVLGKGAMGSVYAAFDPKLHREVAIKVVSDELARDPKSRERFHREARAIAALKQPNIVEIYDYSGEESEHLYLVMEKLDGDDLFNIINEKGVAPEPAAAAIGHELCLALAVAHDGGIIHRDLKPENVFMNDAGRVVLTDFGVVKAIREDSAVDGWAQKTDVIGTPGFMAPELMMNRSLGPRTDIFALGALLYNVATGELPFGGDSPVEMFRAAVAGKYTDPRQYNPFLSEEFCGVLDGCLQAKPRKRFRSADQLRDELKGVLEANGVSDLRDDLRDYMRDPVSYRQLARRRAAGYLLQRLKVAVKDKDEAGANQIRKRLGVIDPDNEEIDAISGFVFTDTGRISVRQSSGTPTMSGGNARWLYLLAGVLASISVILAAYLALRSAPVCPENACSGHGACVETPNGTPACQCADGFVAKELTCVEKVADPPPDEPVVPAPTRVVVTVKGTAAKIYVDGKLLGKSTRKTAILEPGEHTVEVRGRGKRRVKTAITLDTGQTVGVTADLKRNKIQVNDK
ncbi:MAG: hypothetical protein A2289_22145 [Deltaproteobacteria bacterium RIFOXYA12_FULL_58_15]|nr:MAG: hypothetical protein A2289_22145 [Deltaproteobacteria bacterium RIFOXYA12_FULL_58_15]OGR12598.1 MAG: hypothetical protein A2341_23795 [Deltaproteobacteria bacterium RIFOXYB12_FULL_58_9]